MTWFKVDGRFYSHPKVTATSLAARGLWVSAGSWSSDHLTDGVVPDHVLASLGGTRKLADELVTAGLWRRQRHGYLFHEWSADADGTVRNPTRSEETSRKQKQSSGGSLGNHRRWHVDKGKTDPECAYCQHKPRSPTDRPPDRIPEGGTESGANPPYPYPIRSDGSYVGRSSSGNATREPTDDDLDRVIALVGELAAVALTRDAAAAVWRRILDGRAVARPWPYVAKALRGDVRAHLPDRGDPADRSIRDVLDAQPCEHGAPGGVGCVPCRRRRREAG